MYRGQVKRNFMSILLIAMPQAYWKCTMHTIDSYMYIGTYNVHELYVAIVVVKNNIHTHFTRENNTGTL